jgi:7-cyano-7-deazaguanine reductase
VKNEKSSYQGLQSHVRNLPTPAIEVWDNQYADREYQITIEIPEFTCICPKTGLPDFATIKIDYSPAKMCLELKSLKMYIVYYRNVGIFHEHLVNKILDDIVKACGPRWVHVEAGMNPRGGIATTVCAEYKQKK